MGKINYLFMSWRVTITYFTRDRVDEIKSVCRQAISSKPAANNKSKNVLKADTPVTYTIHCNKIPITHSLN